MPWYWLSSFILLLGGVFLAVAVSNWFFLLVPVAAALAVIGYRDATASASSPS
jgi:hypothetical protein